MASSRGDTAADSVALMLGLIAVTVRDRTAYAWRWLAIPVVALINGMALLVVAVLIVVEAIRRLTRGIPEVHGLPVLIVSAVTVAVLLVGARVLGASAANEDLHMRSVLLDTLADAASAGAVAVAGAVMALTGRFFWLDPVLAAAIAGLVAGPASALSLKAVSAIRGRAVDFMND